MHIEMEGVLYKAMVESLIYTIVGTRLNLTFAVNTLNQFTIKVGLPHGMVVKCIMIYLKGTLDLKLCFRGKDNVLRGFCNADWMGDTNDQQSITEYVYLIGNGVILWKRKKQPTVSLFTMEVAYMATSHCMKEAIWYRQLLADVEYVQEGTTSIMGDNQRCITLVKNPKYHSCPKHIGI